MAERNTAPFSAEMEAQVCERVTSADRRHGLIFRPLGQQVPEHHSEAARPVGQGHSGPPDQDMAGRG